MFSFKHETSLGHNNNFYTIKTGEWKTSNLFSLIGAEDEDKQTKLVNLKVLSHSVSKAYCKSHFRSQS